MSAFFLQPNRFFGDRDNQPVRTRARRRRSRVAQEGKGDKACESIDVW
jgi:hypothetical protein